MGIVASRIKSRSQVQVPGFKQKRSWQWAGRRRRKQEKKERISWRFDADEGKFHGNSGTMLPTTLHSGTHQSTSHTCYTKLARRHSGDAVNQRNVSWPHHQSVLAMVLEGGGAASP